MFLTITSTTPAATDLGYLLHKHPGKVQSFEVAVGQVYVFYPEATKDRCTAAVLLEVDPTGLVRGKRDGDGFSLAQYVNDRPYAASSMLAVALGRVFRTAMSGRCDARPELPARSLRLEVHVPALPCRGGVEVARRLFAPLGWTVRATALPVDPLIPAWGESRYVDLRLSGELRLADALNHLYVLLPVLDNAKHYWVTTDEVDKLVRAGAGWLHAHPERDLVTRRYLAHQKELVATAVGRLAEADDAEPEALDNAVPDGEADDVPERQLALAEQRKGAVLAVLRAAGATRVADLGCGEGALLQLLLKDPAFHEVLGVDVSARALEIAARRLRLERMPERQRERERVRLIQSSLTYRDDRIAGYDAAVLMEVIEHVDPPRLGALERAVFGHAKPSTVVVTTPNVEHNVRYADLPAGAMRHRDHRFEWTRAQFRGWADTTASTYGYEVRYLPVGMDDPEVGPPTQMAVFKPPGVRDGRAHDSGAVSRRADRRVGVGQVDLRAHPLRPVRGTLQRLLPRPGGERRERPSRHLRRVRRAALHRGQAARADRTFGGHVVRRQRDQLRRSLRGLAREGFCKVHVLHGVEEVEAARIVRERLLNDYRHETGPFDVIGDVHGCRAELETLLDRLGYTLVRDGEGRPVDAVPPQGRKAVFVGDLVDRGPDSPGVLRLVMGMTTAGHALAVPGNHENKLVRALSGRNVQVTHGLAETLAQLAGETDEFRGQVESFCRDLVSHLVLDSGRLVVAHAGLKEAYHGRASARVRSFALYGETTGETDEFGLPVRYPWAADYRGTATVLYGHTPTPEPEWVNNTMCLDTGCVFGGKLTALRYPEKEIVAVPAQRIWYEPAKPFPPAEAVPAPATAGRREPDVLDITDVLGKRVVETRHHGRVTVREEQAAGALEVMSRFAIDPRWLLYLPPTMAPCATSHLPDLLEHPAEAFDAYRADGIAQVMCEEKHMGSRAVVLVCRDGEAARTRFGATDGMSGAVYTRTGRPFFAPDRTEELLDRLRTAVGAAGLWGELDTGWLLLDCELLPWSVKAEDLLRHQYAAVGAAARAALPVAVDALRAARESGLDVNALLARTRARADNAEAFTAAYRRYCWPVDGLDGVRLAPFQVLAAEGATYHQRDHGWHLSIADRIAAAAPDLVQTTRRLVVDTTDPDSTAAAVDWWEQLVTAGGEGMVVKPHANLVRGRKGPAQAGIKVRGREYLRIIYGPDYTEPANLDRLRQRGLGARRSLALREYALGLEALDRVARGEPLWRVHEAVFAVLALESEPVDPRL